MLEALFWPALLGYGEAAVAYASARTSRAATWGVRLGWLAQTALLVVQAARAEAFPWSSWAGSLNLFVWLVVGAYLIWGCRPRYRLLGLSVMPLAALLFVVARIGGGTDAGAKQGYGNLFLVLHVGLVLAAFAGFTLAAGLAGFYLWQERRLKNRAADILQQRLPPLQSLERLARRTIAVSLPLLTVGLLIGVVRQRRDGGHLDALEAVTLLTWLVYGAIVVTRPTGRRAADLALGTEVARSCEVLDNRPTCGSGRDGERAAAEIKERDCVVVHLRFDLAARELAARHQQTRKRGHASCWAEDTRDPVQRVRGHVVERPPAGTFEVPGGVDR